MLKIYASLAFLCISGWASANQLTDSIGVTNENGKKVILHKVGKQETYFALGKRYQVDYKEIIKYNQNANLKIGSVVKIPTLLPFTNAGSSNSKSNSTPTTSGGTNPQIHTVQRGETLFSIAREYGITPQQIKTDNSLTSNQLSVGQELKINASFNKDKVTITEAKKVQQMEQKSTPKTTSITESKIITNVEEKSKPIEVKKTTPSTSGPKVITHKVQNNETLYSIATQYKTTMNKLMEDNDIPNYQIQIGQVLYINGNQKQYNSQNVVSSSPVSTAANDEEVSTTIIDPKLRRDPSVYGLHQVDEKGTAMWIDDKDLDNNKMLVLHRTAPVGTIIRVTNPMNNRSTFAKVVGSFTDNESTKSVIILMTKAVANSIGAIDKKFYCNINYGISAEETE